MYNKNRILSLLYKCIIIMVAAIGLYLNSGMPNGKFASAMFLYYTILSNLFCLLYFIVACIVVVQRIRKDGIYGESTWAIHAKGAVIMAITVTLLIYWFILVGAGFEMGEGTSPLANLIVHLFVPVLSILDWVIFDIKGQLNRFDPFKWLIIPLCYYVFTVIAAKLGMTFYNGSHYPYFFIDSDILGWGTVMLSVLGLAVAFLVIGYIVFAMDKILCIWRNKIERIK
ncbi:Pr6Pr family membrane protein [Anaerosporobacter sp.]|uniref:Pr6Pr family membrane protein n=1 Tax=Anaerosporobacter sp. TaxID=1872529 RepID=UPI00286ED169|nr:Pr6Pr family membrane protein [Anaerosporobacter sp.]